MKTEKTHLGILLVCMLFLASCRRDGLDVPHKPQDLQVTFSLQLPRSAAAAPAGGLTEEEERMITDLAILLLIDQPSGDPTCIAKIENLNPAPVPGTDNGYYTVTTRLPRGSYRIMLLANVPAASISAITEGSSLSDIQRSLVYSMQAKWDLSTHLGFPMWGVTAGEVTITGAYTHPDPILMLRMLARINVSVDDPVKNDIQINSISLHNPSSRGLVIPLAANLDATTNPGYIRAIAPSLPLSSAGVPDPGLLATPWKYSGPEIEDGNYCLNTIYALEGFHPQGLGDDDYAWLEIACSYQGRPEKQYRVDFVETLSDGTREPIGLLRNYTYQINILSMSGDDQLEIEVLPWNDADMSEVVIEGRYFLKVNQATFHLDREERDDKSFNNRLSVETNYEGGWQVTRITEPGDGAPIDPATGWIGLETLSGPQGKTEDIAILIEENTTGAPRSAEIHIQVGRLIDYIVTVVQDIETTVELLIQDENGKYLSDITFLDYHNNPNAFDLRKFTVQWTPRRLNCQVQVSLLGDEPFRFGPGSDVIANTVLTGASGAEEFTITPARFTADEIDPTWGRPFLHRGMRVTYTVTDDLDPANTVSRTINLSYQNIAILSRDLRKFTYPGVSHNFHVLSNTTWELERIDDPAQLLTQKPAVPTSGGNNIATGDPMNYGIAGANPGTLPGTGQVGRKATLYFRDKQGIIPDLVPLSTTAVYDDPNCYMADIGNQSQQIRIPIRKFHWVWDRQLEETPPTSTTGDWQASVIWDDVYDAAYNKVTYSDLNGRVTFSRDNVSTGEIFEDVLVVDLAAQPGAQGSVLVGVYSNSGTLLWSWHLWLTPYDPYQNANTLETASAYFMLRNLGAISDAQDVNRFTTGYYYQWGRKDPLHGESISPSSPWVTELNNLKNSILHPDIFYLPYTDLRDWYTSSWNERRYQNDYLWNDVDNRKTFYDPCPDGYRVPGFSWEDLLFQSPFTETQPQNEIYNSTNQMVGAIRSSTLYPAQTMFLPAGGRYNSDGEYDRFPGFIYLFQSTPVRGGGRDFMAGAFYYQQGGLFNESGSEYRGAAIPVRCVRMK